MIFSIIIPTYNRPAALSQCLVAISQLDAPPNEFEVIIVDDGGEQPLDPVIAPFQDRLNIHLIRQENAGPGIARNRGAAEAAGMFLAFTDDDCLPAPGWLCELGAALQAHPEALVGGRTINALTKNPYSSASQQIVDIVYRHYNADPTHATFFASNNIAAARSAFLAVGGFDERRRYVASEDRELCDRWRFQGGAMRCVASAVLYHAHRLTMCSYVRQHFQYGQGAYQFHEVRAERGSGTLARETSFHLNFDNWLFRPLREASGLRQKATILMLLGLWQGINIVGYFYAMLRAKIEKS